MKNMIRYTGALLYLIIILASCQKLATPYLEAAQPGDRALVYFARFTGNSPNLPTFPFVDSARTIKFAAAFGALGLPPADIPVTYTINKSAFDSVNNVRVKSGLKPYQEFPQGSYSISSMNTVISAGQLNSRLETLSYFSKKFNPDTDYLLPLSITTAGDYQVGSNNTIFFTVPRLEETPAAKTAWTVTANSEEVTGEGSSNGKAAYAIDGNINTYWHSQWQGASPPFPHWLLIDMKSDVYVTRVDMAARQNASTGFTRFNLEGSLDGEKWTILGSDLVFDPAIKSFQSYRVPEGYRRFMRITALGAQSATMTSTHLAEVTIYKY